MYHVSSLHVLCDLWFRVLFKAWQQRVQSSTVGTSYCAYPRPPNSNPRSDRNVPFDPLYHEDQDSQAQVVELPRDANCTPESWCVEATNTFFNSGVMGMILINVVVRASVCHSSILVLLFHFVPPPSPSSPFLPGFGHGPLPRTSCGSFGWRCLYLNGLNSFVSQRSEHESTTILNMWIDTMNYDMT